VQTYALLGNASHMIPIPKRLLHIRYLTPLAPALVQIDPMWDPIQNDPRFQELAAEKRP
jgi:hypothetical protein